MAEEKPNVNAGAPQHLNIKIKSQEGDHIEFKVKPTTKFEKVRLTPSCTAIALPYGVCTRKLGI